jgi:isoquinoline 1-oxidoreductase subunit beta
VLALDVENHNSITTMKVLKKTVGQRNDYDASCYAGMLKLAQEKSGLGKNQTNIHRGISAYFCHNSYVAQVLDLSIEKGNPVVKRVCCAVDCGIVINPDVAINLKEGAIVDAIGNALYRELTFINGVPEKNNFNKYRMIRHNEAPKAIDVHFVMNDIDPTGMGEPAFPPVFAALANALYKATGKRFYDQPFISQLNKGQKGS